MKYLILSLCICLPLGSISAAAPQETISYSNAQVTLIDNVDVASLDPGVVQSLTVSPGDSVKAGELLLTLDSDLHESEAQASDLAWQIAIEESKSDVDLRLSQKSLAVSQKQLQKSENAVAEYRLSISETEIDRLRLERDQASLSIEQAKMQGSLALMTADLREAEKTASSIRLRRRKIASPIDGVVAEVATERGEAVQSGQMVVRVIGLDKLRVKAFYKSEYALQVKAKQKAVFEFERAGEVVSREAEIVFVSPEVRVSEGVFEVWADVDNLDRELLPGFKGTLQIKL